MQEHVMTTVGDDTEARCILCGGVWVKNLDLNPHNRKPNWKTDAGEYWTPNCLGPLRSHADECNCRKCLEKSL